MSLNSITLRSQDEIARFFAESTGMIPGYRQLSRGAAQIEYVTADLGGVSILWSRNSAHALWRDEMIAEAGLQIGCLIDAGGEVMVRGVEVSRNHALLWMAGEEIEYLHKDGIVSLEVWVDQSIVEEFGWEPFGEPLRSISDGYLDVLVRVSQDATNALGRYEGSARMQAEVSYRTAVLDALVPIVNEWMGVRQEAATQLNSATRHYSVFSDAEREFDRRTEDNLTIDGLARAIGVSRRTLYQAFEKSVGVGPRRFFEVKRLHRLHDCLRTASSDNATVTSLATDLDFSDLGRMARSYRDLFGENPSQTLSRRA